MSAATLPGGRPTIEAETGADVSVAGEARLDGTPVGCVRRQPARPNVLRRPNFEQGRALEILGHSIEYLVDSRMHDVGHTTSRADAEAVQILSRLSREVFFECAEVVPMMRRLRLWINDRLGIPSNC